MEFSVISNYFTTHLKDLFIVIPMAIFGYLFAKLCKKGLVNKLPLGNDETVRLFLANILYVFILIVVAIMILGKLGFPTATLITIIGASGLAIGLALQSTLSNVAAGIMLVFTRPFHVGDLVEFNGAVGTVEQINIFNTQVRSGNNDILTVPNSKIIAGQITNRTARPVRRVSIIVGVGRKADLSQVKALIFEQLQTIDKVLPKPEAAVLVNDISNAAVNINVRAWVKKADFAAVKAQLLEKIQIKLQQEGIPVPDASLQ